jgi:hypothetical protein
VTVTFVDSALNGTSSLSNVHLLTLAEDMPHAFRPGDVSQSKGYHFGTVLR